MRLITQAQTAREHSSKSHHCDHMAAHCPSECRVGKMAHPHVTFPFDLQAGRKGDGLVVAVDERPDCISALAYALMQQHIAGAKSCCYGAQNPAVHDL
jgi:hypothetical protein